MRNLRNLGHSVLRYESSKAPSACAWDASSDSIYFAFGPSETNNYIELRRWSSQSDSSDNGSQMSQYITSWEALSPNPELPVDRILEIHHFPDSNETTLVLAGGDIVNVSSATAQQAQQIEIVGSVDAGIAAAAWSSDEELLVILTNADTFLYMTRDFDNIASVDLSPDDLKASKQVSVGWGKAETQFRGKGAKALRDPTVPEKVDEGLFSATDGKESTISWRGDGAYVAVNSSLAGSRRVIRVYSREGELDGVSEPVDYMESALSWRPAGNIIASVQRLQERVDVIFFERNGLRHGQFSLRVSEKEMKTWASKIQLQWNIDSSILAVSFLDRIQLWTMGNYHYYLKQEIRFPEIDSPTRLPFFAWHSEQSLQFVVGLEGTVRRSQYGYRIASGSTIPPHDYGLISVIDGTSLKITPLRISNVPPPMALAEISVRSNIVDVTYAHGCENDSSTVTFGVLDQTELSIFVWNLKEDASGTLKRSAVCDLGLESPSLGEDPLRMARQIAFADYENLLMLSSGSQGSLLTTLKLRRDSLQLVRTATTAFVTELVSLSAGDSSSLHLWSKSLVTPFSDGMIDNNGRELDVALEDLGSPQTKIPPSSENVALARFEDDDSGGNVAYKQIVFALQRNGILTADGVLLARGCTSFLITTSHLIFTTSQHLLKFVHLTASNKLEVPCDVPEVDERCRSIERGARLITVVPSTSALILQMPRGNLETIYPRALVLPLIRTSINQNKYRKAFFICRKHRVDLNILHDHSPEKFLKGIDAFINQVQKAEHIDLFLSQLREEDVSETMYRDTVPKQALNGDQERPLTHLRNTAVQGLSKVNRICDAFLASLADGISRNLQNVITAHVCKNPPDLEAGLLQVAETRKRNMDDGDQMVEHICFLADVNRLFDTALGLYDLDLTLQIAQQSQRDPREYIPFLQKLKDQDELRRRVDIDNHLRRFGKVLIHLKELNDFQSLHNHTVKHSLYKEAIELYRYQETQVKEIMQSYAEYLSKNSRHKEAGIAHEYLSHFEAASESYRLAHLWQESLTCASIVPMDEQRLQALATSIAESQVESKDFKPAAIIYQDYLNDIEEAVRLFCKGCYFADAFRLVSLHGTSEALQSIVDSGLAEGQATMTEMLADCKTQLNAQIPRIRELRVKKSEEPLAFYGAEVEGGANIPDNISLAGTDTSTVGGTLFTRYTNQTGTVGTNATRRTSKNRRREERKRARGKKGSVYEEEYLVNSVARLIDRINSVADEVERLVIGLMRRGMRERARAVEAAIVAVIDLCREHSAEVFQSAEKLQMGQAEEASLACRPSGGDAVFLESVEETRVPKEPPAIRDFQKLSLIG